MVALSLLSQYNKKCVLLPQSPLYSYIYKSNFGLDIFSSHNKKFCRKLRNFSCTHYYKSVRFNVVFPNLPLLSLSLWLLFPLSLFPSLSLLLLCLSLSSLSLWASLTSPLISRSLLPFPLKSFL